jgi:hypothetical protein
MFSDQVDLGGETDVVVRGKARGFVRDNGFGG